MLAKGSDSPVIIRINITGVPKSQIEICLLIPEKGLIPLVPTAYTASQRCKGVSVNVVGA
jgi:hypothetical protein